MVLLNGLKVLTGGSMDLDEVEEVYGGQIPVRSVFYDKKQGLFLGFQLKSVKKRQDRAYGAKYELEDAFSDEMSAVEWATEAMIAAVHPLEFEGEDYGSH